MKKLFLAVLALFIATPAFAQAWTVGEGPQPVAYSNSNPGVLGDGSDEQGGVAPGYIHEEPDYPSNFTVSDWVKTGGGVTRPPAQAKFRTHCNVSHRAQEDPILYPGLANHGHDHTFFGNRLAGKDSTYQSLRTTGASTCAGGPVNRTAYWFPSMLHTLSSGAVAAIKPDFIIVYYTISGAPSNSVRNSRFPRGFRYIGGVDPSNYNDTARKAEVPAGFVYRGNGFDGWKCLTPGDILVKTSDGQDTSKRFVNADGSDPWAGACPAGYKLVGILSAPGCWDGHNITSPNGRDHLRYSLRHINSGRNDICPNGWYQFPGFEGTFYFSHNGWNDYKNWYLSSDRMNAPSTAADPTSLSPCRATGPYFCPGETFHFDWFGAWEYGTAAAPGAMLKWLINCTGVKVTMGGTTAPGNPGECNDSALGNGERILTNGATSPDTSLSLNPVITFNSYYDDPPTTRHLPLSGGTTGDVTIQHNHGGGGGMALNDNFPASNDNWPVLALNWSLAAGGF